MNKEIGEDRTRWEGQIQRKTGDTERQRGRERKRQRKERGEECVQERQREARHGKNQKGAFPRDITDI